MEDDIADVTTVFTDTILKQWRLELGGLLLLQSLLKKKKNRRVQI